MTEQEREELIEKMAKAICDLYKLNPNDWREWRKECRAALAVAEPVIREQCAEIARNKVLTSEDCCDATGAKIATAIREATHD